MLPGLYDLLCVPWIEFAPGDPRLFPVGVTWGVGYERAKPVGVPTVMQMSFNVLNVVMALLTTPRASEATIA